MKKTLIAAVAATALVLASCSDKQTERFKDAPRGEYDRTPANVLAFPDGFSNVAYKCEGPNRVYVVFHNNAAYGSVAVVKDDPRCPKAES